MPRTSSALNMTVADPRDHLKEPGLTIVTGHQDQPDIDDVGQNNGMLSTVDHENKRQKMNRAGV